MITSVKFLDPERLGTKQKTIGETWNFLGRGNEMDFKGELRVGWLQTGEGEVK